MLAVKNLEVNYGAIRAVHGISLHVEMGELVALIGNNGAGKTSTLKAITGVVTNVKGSVELNGENITGKPSDKIAAKRVAMVPEGRRIFSGMNVRENLEMGAFLRRDTPGVQQDMETVFTLFPVLKERCKQQAGTLSGRGAADAGYREGDDGPSRRFFFLTSRHSAWRPWSWKAFLKALRI